MGATAKHLLGQHLADLFVWTWDDVGADDFSDPRRRGGPGIGSELVSTPVDLIREETDFPDKPHQGPGRFFFNRRRRFGLFAQLLDQKASDLLIAEFRHNHFSRFAAAGIRP